MACIGPKSSIAGDLGGISKGKSYEVRPQNQNPKPNEVLQNNIETNLLGNDVNLKGIKLER